MVKRAVISNLSYTLFLVFYCCLIIFSALFLELSKNLFLFIIFCNFISILSVILLLKSKIEFKNVEADDLKITKIESKSSHLTTIINNLPLIAFIIDKNYKFVTGNIEALKFFNVTKQEQFRKLSLDVFERKTMELIKEENDLIKKNKKTFVTDREVRLKDGKQQWLRIRKVPILDKKDNVDSLVVFGRSINTERAAQKQRETYISTLSHDLKIPTLAQIRALELLVNEKMGKINDQQRELLNLTLDSCYCMYDMLSTLLTTYKFENNDIVLNYEKIQMLKVLDESFSKYLREIKHKNIKIKLSAKDKFVSLYADKIQMKKAFENLINYCISSAYENTEINCEISKNAIENSINISLSFESPYKTPENIKNMFCKYTTSAEKMDKVGSSLNLYLAKQIINAHHGIINVESQKSNYNSYNIELPYINECKFSSISN